MIILAMASNLKALQKNIQTMKLTLRVIVQSI